MGLGGKFNTPNPYHTQYTDPAGNCVLDITDEVWYDGVGQNTTLCERRRKGGPIFLDVPP